MLARLKACQTCNAVAGLPMSGRNRQEYVRMVIEDNSLFGNLYALKTEFLDRVRSMDFRLPRGLSWIDACLSSLVNRDLQDGPDWLPGKVTHDPAAGYRFDSLSPFRLKDFRIYKNRRVRYALGRRQVQQLLALPFSEWPADLEVIDRRVMAELTQRSIPFWNLDDRAVLKRLERRYGPSRQLDR
jgi:hypothetical protein